MDGAVQAAAAALQADEPSIKKRPARPQRRARTTRAGRAVNPAALLQLRAQQLTSDRADFLAGTIAASEARLGLEGLGWTRHIAVVEAREAGQTQATEYLDALWAFDAAAVALALALPP